MKNPIRVYQIWSDGSGELVAEFQYPGQAELFVNRAKIADFIIKPNLDDYVTLVVVDHEGNIRSEAGRKLVLTAEGAEEG